jgi:cyclopropane fatty-acyl-phospholipid synthase-like methyltransferase
MIDTHTAAFDSVGTTYDDAFTTTMLGETYRARTQTRLAQFRVGMRVLELGCGTGEDAVWLAQRGVHVIATDVSLAMLEQTRIKARRAGVEHLIETRLLDLNEPSLDTNECFDGAFSNFGALNCVRDLARVARWLAARVKPNGLVILVVMGPLCPWEIAAHAMHRDLQGAMRRLRRQGVVAHIREASCAFLPKRSNSQENLCARVSSRSP